MNANSFNGPFCGTTRQRVAEISMKSRTNVNTEGTMAWQR
jgi:hypothetical protein